VDRETGREAGQEAARRGFRRQRPTLAGVQVREEDLVPMPGLKIVAGVFKVCALVILILAAWQLVDWWIDRPPGNVGLALIVGESIRLIVLGALLWAASHLAGLLIRTHYDVRAGRILLSRQEYLLRQMAQHAGALPAAGQTSGDRRDATPEEGAPPDGARPEEPVQGG
jgi:hypothetical protein